MMIPTRAMIRMMTSTITCPTLRRLHRHPGQLKTTLLDRASPHPQDLIPVMLVVIHGHTRQLSTAHHLDRFLRNPMVTPLRQPRSRIPRDLGKLMRM